MLLFADGNAKEKKFPSSAKPDVRVWLSGFMEAKKLFVEIFNDKALEDLVASFIFNERYLRNALGE